jgi:transcriptional regulator with XRE-family HTH domain
VKNRVRELREAKGLSQSKLAGAMDVSQTIVSRIEKGDQAMSDEQMLQIATKLDVHPVELIDDPRWNKIPYAKIDQALLRFINKIIIGLIKRHPSLDENLAADVMTSLYQRYATQPAGAKDRAKSITDAAEILIGHELAKKH